jgi:hypothetical protein
MHSEIVDSVKYSRCGKTLKQKRKPKLDLYVMILNMKK